MHQRILLMSTANRKRKGILAARHLYISPMFQLGLNYANQFDTDAFFLLSAKYGLLDPEKELSAYPETMSSLKKDDIKEWANAIVEQLKNNFDLEETEVIVLALSRFAKPISMLLPKYKAPLLGMTMSEALAFLRNNS